MCEHYNNSVHLVAPCCEKEYKCRFCHDKREDHTLNRYDVKEVKCDHCHKRQDIRKNCQYCMEIFGKAYTCLICALFSDTNEEQFHCYDCRICRKGGRGNYYHCPICNLCILLKDITTHKCVTNASEQVCAICKIKVNKSQSEIRIFPSGILAHLNCIQD